jgi:hypothetical protein
VHVMSTRFAGSILVLGLLAGVAPVASGADGIIDLSWDTCSPIVVNQSSAGVGSMSLIASVTGNDQTHSAYQVRFQLGDPSELVPDAWRFDGAGCQATALTMNHQVPAALAKSCPAFHANLAFFTATTYSFFPAGSGHATSLADGRLTVAYSAATTSVPGQRYFLAQFLFDHSRSVPGPTTPGVNCGGYESAIFIRLLNDPLGAYNCVYVRESDGAERRFEIGNGLVTVNGIVPAERATWGQIKNAYHR